MKDVIVARGLRIDIEAIPDAREEDFEEYLSRQGLNYGEMMHEFIERAQEFCFYALLSKQKATLQVRPIHGIEEKLFFVMDPLKPSVIVVANKELLNHLVNDPDSDKHVQAEWLLKVNATVLTSESKEIQEHDHSQFKGIDMSKVN